MGLALEKLKIAVLCGGPGAEREVSLASGRAVTENLRRAGLRAEMIVVSGEPTEIFALDCDLAFLAMHGEFGEDGTVQRLLDGMGLPYTGSPANPSALAMDKHATKLRLREAGLPTADWILADRGRDAWEQAAAAGLELPIVVKPVNLGSSVATFVVTRAEDVAGAVAEVLRLERPVLIERFVRGRELTVGLLNGKSLPVIELRTKRQFYDYQAKYLDDNTEYLCPAPLDKQTAERIGFIGLRAGEVLGVEHFGRTDLILGAEGPQVLEVNTIPGFTDHSLLPKAARAAGIEFPRLCAKIVELAWRRHLATVPVGGKASDKG